MACSELLLCLYVSTALMFLARPQQTLVDHGSRSCYLETLTIVRQKESLTAKQWLDSKRDPEAVFFFFFFPTLAQFTHLLVATLIDFSQKYSICHFTG